MFCLYLWWKIGGAVGEIVRIRRILFRSELVLKPYTNHYTNIGYAFPFQTHDESLEVVIFSTARMHNKILPGASYERQVS